MNTKTKILFATDFSEFSLRAFDTAQNMARIYNTDLVVLNSIEISNPLSSFFKGNEEDELREKAYAKIDKLVEEKGDSSITFMKMVKVGKPYNSIIDAAEEVAARLIVMGTHGAEGLKEVFIGSNASRVVRGAPCPVLTIRHSPESLGFKKILLPLDMSKATGEKVNVGIEFAEIFGAELVVISVLSDDNHDSHPMLKARLEKAVDYITKKGVKVEKSVLVTKERPANAVMDYAMQIRADLICLMTQQEDDFNSQVLGSSAEKVVNHSVIPVLSIKPTKEYREVTWGASHFS